MDQTDGWRKPEYKRKDHRVSIGLTEDEYQDIFKYAEASGWTVSEQIRYELNHLRGKAKKPILPHLPNTPPNKSRT